MIYHIGKNGTIVFLFLSIYLTLHGLVDVRCLLMQMREIHCRSIKSRTLDNNQKIFSPKFYKYSFTFFYRTCKWSHLLPLIFPTIRFIQSSCTKTPFDRTDVDLSIFVRFSLNSMAIVWHLPIKTRSKTIKQIVSFSCEPPPSSSPLSTAALEDY